MVSAAGGEHADEWATILDRAGRAETGALARLVDAAGRSPLARFRPYTSMFLLRFDGTLCDGLPPPVSIGLATAPDRYLVWWGQPFSPLERATIVEETTSAREAVALAALLLRNWPFRYELRRPPACAHF
ncbi:hypothetical protein [Actinoplanes sp. HUAS TT8]|uniref:hypothetical protein n=1 Tax=Actinoplanes sp. HUAS TT8 TaxID=3447453 RepID=UPI003F520DA1